MQLNKYSKRITQDPTQPASQAMLYGVGLSEEDMKIFTKKLNNSNIISDETHIFSISTKTKDGIPNLIEYIEKIVFEKIIKNNKFESTAVFDIDPEILGVEEEFE